MKTALNIKNFRVFDENGAFFELNPITILTGANSSGKSSAVKALLLLQDFCKQLKADFEDGKNLRLGEYMIDFHKQHNSVLGTFEHVLHKRNRSEENSESSDRIIIEIGVPSSFLTTYVILHLEFGMLEGDYLKNGYLMAYSIRTNDGVIYSAGRDGETSMNFQSVKKDLLQFLYGQHAYAKWQALCLEMQTQSDSPSKEDEKYFTEANNNLSNISRYFVRDWQVSHRGNDWRDGYHIPAESLLGNSLKTNVNKIDQSFIINSPNLGVFCYYPCLELLKDVEKQEIRTLIYEKIKSNDLDLSRMIDLSFMVPFIENNSTPETILNSFLTEFESSEANSLHEYISKLEDDFFFVKNRFFRFGNSENFIFPSYGPEFDNSNYKRLWPTTLLAMQIINRVLIESNTQFIDYVPDPYIDGGCTVEYFMENSINKYLRKALEDIFYQLLPSKLSYAAATIIQPRRMYSLEDNDIFSSLLKHFFELKRLWDSEDGADPETLAQLKLQHHDFYQSGEFMNKWIQKLGIAHHIEIKPDEEGVVATIRLFEDENDKKGMLLADKGVGILQIFLVLLKIETAILESQLNDLRNPDYTLGLDDNYRRQTYSNRNPITVALEEPEIHLHPKYQSLLADMFLEAYEKYNIHFIIETHSEYLIRKTQVFVANHNYKDEETMKSENPFKVYYIPQSEKPYEMKYRTDGKFSNEFGTGFFDEANNLVFDIL